MEIAEAIVRRSDRLITQVGRNAAIPDGHERVRLTPRQAVDLAAALTGQNGGVILQTDGTIQILTMAPAELPPATYTEGELVQMADGVATIADARAMLRLLARSAAGRIPKPPA